MRDSAVIFVLLMCASCGTRPVTDEDGSATSATTTSSTESETGESSNPSDSGPGDTDTDTDTEGGMEDMPPQSCDSFLQDCPDGQKCVPWSPGGSSWDANKCVPVLGEQAPGESCTYDGVVEGTDNCDATSWCFDTDEINGELVGTCHPFCTGTPRTPECPEGQQCMINSGPVTLCFPLCDPISQDCEGGEICYWSGTIFTCIDPLNPPGVPVGEPCSFPSDCEMGAVCLDASFVPNCMGTGCCAAFCDVGLGDMQCAASPGTVCTPFFEMGMEPEGYDHVGVCIVPP